MYYGITVAGERGRVRKSKIDPKCGAALITTTTAAYIHYYYDYYYYNYYNKRESFARVLTLNTAAQHKRVMVCVYIYI